MEKVAIIGPIDEVGKQAIRDELKDFICVDVKDETEYDKKLKDVQYAILRTSKLKSDGIAKAPNLK